ncbi:hypothetical protein H6F77_07015 [Microcoleus sp. FACHB-831]|uniref:hypothetical protein n=1 Tax=Microcoleus sp. FACHB-831 TaxID=2692827 RepID=UPI00198CF711|nr:hypothetical protein [Microcoleus sp. FACHB-831]MBD1920835.1 hypothetical protein [Microcoleus sp. FACHB-831]
MQWSKVRSLPVWSPESGKKGTFKQRRSWKRSAQNSIPILNTYLVCKQVYVALLNSGMVSPPPSLAVLTLAVSQSEKGRG